MLCDGHLIFGGRDIKLGREINISFQLVSQFPVKYTVVLYCECIMSDMKINTV